MWEAEGCLSVGGVHMCVGRAGKKEKKEMYWKGDDR